MDKINKALINVEPILKKSITMQRDIIDNFPLVRHDVAVTLIDEYTREVIRLAQEIRKDWGMPTIR